VAAHEDEPGEADWWAQLASVDWGPPHAASPDPTSAASPISALSEALGRIAYEVRHFWWIDATPEQHIDSCADFEDNERLFSVIH
jgi:hypothetical protein